MNAILKLKYNKAPEFDGMSAELFKYVEPDIQNENQNRQIVRRGLARELENWCILSFLQETKSIGLRRNCLKIANLTLCTVDWNALSDPFENRDVL